ncbi:hypothetical protein [Actinomadura rugatobispora]|uniref:Uncharacterized protein n=1 Tax=Actinomadura rugatobispora TaxID=1994 RepID=A0ABW0ZN69_9ACTN|nr:hypothetical protein GCM10010200_035450 [Actinomadura rugatobispora]
MSEHSNPAEEPTPRRAGRGDDTTKLLIVVNAALIGVPAAYATSQSVPVTVIAAVVAIVLVFLSSRHR